MSLYSSITRFKDKRRNRSKSALIDDFLDSSSSLIDIGTGSGGLALYLKKKGFEVTSVDIVNKTTYPDISPIVYDGKTLPFQDNSFDVAMLITVLHHCPQPEQVFAEAVRVSNKKIIVLEDVYSNWLMKRLTWFMDSLVNLEFKGHPHSNKSETEWEALFQKHNLRIKQKTTTKVLGIFTQVMYHLEK
jgi:ubiquinone/menaquinone biosynthesis C-methylase UbiE